MAFDKESSRRIAGATLVTEMRDRTTTEPPSQRRIVRGGTDKFRLIRALVKEPSGATQGLPFTVDNVVAVAGGLSPTNSASEELEIQGALSDYSDNAVIYAVYEDESDEWRDFTPGGSGGSPVWRFELQADKPRESVTAMAWLLDADGNHVGDTMGITDRSLQWRGFGPYSDPQAGEVKGDQGYVLAVTDPSDGSTTLEMIELTTRRPYAIVDDPFATTDWTEERDSVSVGNAHRPVPSTSGAFDIDTQGVKRYDLRRLIYYDLDRDEHFGIDTVPGKIGLTETTISAASPGTVTSGIVSLHHVNSGNLEDSLVDETWYNMAIQEGIPNQTWVQAKPVKASNGSIVWVIDWVECDP